jgi:hypothetical protein
VSGGIRSVDRTTGGRRYKGVLLSGRLNNSRGGGYVMVNMTDDTGAKRTMLAHRVILLTHAGECPEGLETLHSKRGSLWCRVPEDMRYGTRKENVAQLVAEGHVRAPLNFPCINHDRCGGMAANPGRRCLSCVREAGCQAAQMLEAGVSLDEVTRMLGYKGYSWVYKIARDFGGYTGSLDEARSQRQRWPLRVMTTFRHWRRSRGGDGT